MNADQSYGHLIVNSQGTLNQGLSLSIPTFQNLPILSVWCIILQSLSIVCGQKNSLLSSCLESHSHVLSFWPQFISFLSFNSSFLHLLTCVCIVQATSALLLLGRTSSFFCGTNNSEVYWERNSFNLGKYGEK
jgi:hypothetical protein